MATDVYTTLQGDAWDAIAYRLWGEERLAHLLVTANPDHADVLIFAAGVRLCVPDAPSAAPAKKSELPPWM